MVNIVLSPTKPPRGKKAVALSLGVSCPKYYEEFFELDITERHPSDCSKEEIHKACTEEDVSNTLDFVELTRDVGNLHIYDDYNNQLAWQFALGINCYLLKSAKYALINTVKTHPLQTLSNLWVVSLFDYHLKQGGRLITCTEEYWVTGIVMTPDGKIIS